MTGAAAQANDAQVAFEQASKGQNCSCTVDDTCIATMNRPAKHRCSRPCSAMCCGTSVWLLMHVAHDSLQMQKCYCNDRVKVGHLIHFEALCSCDVFEVEVPAIDIHMHVPACNAHTICSTLAACIPMSGCKLHEYACSCVSGLQIAYEVLHDCRRCSCIRTKGNDVDLLMLSVHVQSKYSTMPLLHD